MASSLWKQCFCACETGRNGVQILRKTGSHKNWLEPAKINIVLSMVWSLISNSLHLHYNTKIHSPLTMTGAVIVPRLTIEGQKVIPKSRVWLLTTQKPIKRPGWWKGTFTLFWMPVCTLVWKIPWAEEPGKLQSMGLLRVGHN